jgi:DsbC/DsbD-like thiol-disulfide interchange protein
VNAALWDLSLRDSRPAAPRTHPGGRRLTPKTPDLITRAGRADTSIEGKPDGGSDMERKPQSAPAVLRIRRLDSFLSLVLCVCAANVPASLSAAGNTTGSTPHSKVDLIAEEDSIEPGRRFWVGLRFQLERQWHIYWINPGDSGEPPRLEWHLPAGFRAGVIQWPVPKRLENQSIVDYGYQGEVLLLVPIYAPARFTAGRAKLAATVKWLVCRDVCIPARTDLALSLPVQRTAPHPDPQWHKLFTSGRAELPRPPPANFKATALLQGNYFLLTFDSGSPGRQATFFPLAPMQIENSAPQTATLAGDRVRLSLQKSDQLVKPFASLKGVLVFGPQRAYLIDAPVIAPTSKPKRSE